ncbi:MAG: hypothetical protein V4511_04795 [Bacteroidota bacterium]
MNDNNSSDEIDLRSVFSSIKKGGGDLFRSVGEFIYFSIKNIKTLIAFIIIGVSISLAMFYLKKTVYVSDLTISHTRLNNGECYSLINDLTKPGNDRNDRILSEKLNIDIKMAKQIKSISCKALNEALEKNYKDSAFVLLPFKVEVRVYSASILDSLQSGILHFLESNEYATKRKKISKLYLDKFEEKIKSEIIAIDSLKRIVDKSILPRSLGNGIIMGESIDPVKVYQEGMNLYKSQLNINEQRELNNSFEIIIGFSSPTPSSNLIVNILKGFIFSLLFGVVWLLFKKFNLRKAEIVE